jgi:hypothetical protein
MFSAAYHYGESNTQSGPNKYTQQLCASAKTIFVGQDKNTTQDDGSADPQRYKQRKEFRFLDRIHYTK